MDYKKLREEIKKALARKIMQEKGIKEGYEDADDILASWIAEDIPPMPDPLPKELEELANKGERRLMQILFGKGSTSIDLELLKTKPTDQSQASLADRSQASLADGEDTSMDSFMGEQIEKPIQRDAQIPFQEIPFGTLGVAPQSSREDIEKLKTFSEAIDLFPDNQYELSGARFAKLLKKEGEQKGIYWRLEEKESGEVELCIGSDEPNFKDQKIVLKAGKIIRPLHSERLEVTKAGYSEFIIIFKPEDRKELGALKEWRIEIEN